MRKSILLIILLISLLGIFFRLWHIEFGLPHSFYADEPEIAELAIKYTYEIRSIVEKKDYYKLIPISYVYGSFPSYFFTITVMLFSKGLNLFNISFDKTTLYVFMRVINSILSLSIMPVTSLIAWILTKNKKVAFISFILTTLNWKLIVHAHYINADIILTILLSLSFVSALLYYENPQKSRYTWFNGLLVGLAVGTKITALLTLPLYIYLYVKRKDPRGMFGFLFLIYGVFVITNPFALIFANNFVFRIYEMLFKEAGMVFDSVDSNPFKYIFALGFISTIPILISSIYGTYIKIKEEKNNEIFPIHIFLIGHIIFYLLFYSIQSRRVDRWLLPIIPIVMVYASYGFIRIWDLLKENNGYLKAAAITGGIMTLITYLYFPTLLLFQFQRHTPKSEAYLWMRDNVPTSANKLIYTEEGLDPMNKLPGARVIRYQVYTSESAQFFMPEYPIGYDYIILSSRPMENFKRKEVRKAYPFYVSRWDEFEYTVVYSGEYQLEKVFELPKPNLIPLSDVTIYKKK